MNAHVIETTVPTSGALQVSDLPFSPGTAIEVIVIERPRKAGPAERVFTMRGMPYTYIDPTGSVGEEDWEALK